MTKFSNIIFDKSENQVWQGNVKIQRNIFEIYLIKLN